MQDELLDDKKIADRITANTAKKLKKEKNLILISTGRGMVGPISALGMSFDFYQEVDLNAARDLIVFAVNEYLTAINTSQEIRPYLKEYPFPAKRVKIEISVYSPDRRDLPPGKIQYIECINGVVEYSNFSDLSQPIHTETYDEAFSKIHSSPSNDKKDK